MYTEIIHCYISINANLEPNMGHSFYVGNNALLFEHSDEGGCSDWYRFDIDPTSDLCRTSDLRRTYTLSPKFPNSKFARNGRVDLCLKLMPSSTKRECD